METRQGESHEKAALILAISSGPALADTCNYTAGQTAAFGLCQCAKIMENLVERLQCYDELAVTFGSEEEQIREITRLLQSRQNGGEIMRDELDRLEAD